MIVLTGREAHQRATLLFLYIPVSGLYTGVAIPIRYLRMSALPAFTGPRDTRRVICLFTVLLYTIIAARALALALVAKPESAGYGDPSLYLSLGLHMLQ